VLTLNKQDGPLNEQVLVEKRGKVDAFNVATLNAAHPVECNRTMKRTFSHPVLYSSIIRLIRVKFYAVSPLSLSACICL